MSIEITRRPATEEDRNWLLALRERTMDPHLAASGASVSVANHVERLLYRFELAEVLMRGDDRIGLLKIERDATAWTLIQIQIEPAWQGKGLGSDILRQLISDARSQGVAVVLDVLKANPARALYERHGFVVIGESDHEYHLRCE